jgi:hypothetical protein
MSVFQLFLISSTYTKGRVKRIIGPKHHKIHENYYFNRD